jgi:alkyl-hydroperoxide reductase/thiol specific antioxidant family protein
LQQQQETLRDLGIQVAIVTFETAPFGRSYVAEMKFSWPVLIDRDRTLYRRYGMDRGRLRDIWGARTWIAYFKEFGRGRLPKYSGADARQLGGDVLIDPTGMVRFHHVGSGPGDRPSVAAILEARRQQP